MAALSGSTAQLYLLTFLSLLFLIHARLNLDPSDLQALSTIQKTLGFQFHISQPAPCNTPGVFCERRLSENNTYVLRITRLVFKSHRLDGFLSPAIGRLSELKEISLAHNNLGDQIPSQIVDCRKLEILNLGDNRFSGEVPAGLSNLIRLRTLDLSSNKLSGNLSFLKHFPNLESLSIADNFFSGKIPASIRSFRNLRLFNFAGNEFLDGSLPTMESVEISGTDVPKRYILDENTSTKGHNNTTAAATAQAPTNALAPGPSATPKHKKKNNTKKVGGWLFGFFAGALAGFVSGLMFSLLFKLLLAVVRGGGKDGGPAIFSSLIKSKEDLAFLEKEDGLANLELIGSGGCGQVYKAELPGSNGKMIAIKKIIQPPKDADELTADEESKLMNKKMRQIRSEINTVGKIRHRNLIPLLAHVSRLDCHYLVYEFMKNGSLQDILNQVADGTRQLDWLTRHKIALGIAAGLEYLHLNNTPHIIHRDLKPANVLLDDDMEARIADFGLAKAMPDAHTHISTSNVMGTVGYIAPEYHQTFKFTDRCDIYSFGVVLGVLVMGRLPSDEFFQNTNEMSLVKWMRNVMTSEKPKQAIDEKLIGNGYEEQMLLVLKIACFCTLDNPKERPNSKDVRCMLAQIKH
ncbi:leucine-rich repeat receptor-like serine/threonine/tyrosine-protein kinase SOBIR1 [Pyrus communis]|uniref:leucine-rich repeat receptor-like serine/threonine/tyrosine-protein kinase SOBIR1 n=1 Tax=Pyrus communis TaxID=23211 RepID=UPI0035C144A5